MDVTLSIQTDIANALKKLDNVAPKAWPRIVAHGINKTMATVRAKERDEMAKVFDRPTPFTLNGFYTVPAKPDRLEATIRLKDFAGKGTPAAKYLAPEVYGGTRAHKSHEKALIAAGILPADMFCVPAKELPLDNYGNIRAGLITQILSYLKANPDSYQNVTKQSKSKRKPLEFFAVTPTNRKQARLPFGIYQRKATGFTLIMAFVKQPHYAKRFNFFDVAQATVERFLQGDIAAAAEQSLERGYGSLSLADIPDIIGL